MSDKDLNLFDEYATECVHLCPQEEECTSFSWGDNKNIRSWHHSKFTEDANLNKNGAIAKVKILVEQVIL